jgi:hypothetical protein
MMSIANQPIEQYSNLYTTEQLGPAMTQTQQALANQAAYQSAAAQQDIQSRVDPLAYAQRQMRLQATTDRLGQLYGQDPSAFTFRDPSAYMVPGTNQMPDLAALRRGASAIAGQLATATMSGRGDNPQLQTPSAKNLPTATGPQSYFQA